MNRTESAFVGDVSALRVGTDMYKSNGVGNKWWEEEGDVEGEPSCRLSSQCYPKTQR